MKRQTAVEWAQPENPNLKLRKSKSLPDTSALERAQDKLTSGTANEDEKNEKKTKKKKKGKLSKKAKAVSNAKIFLQKD